MIEIIDRETEKKLMMMIFGRVTFKNNSYVIYCVKRDKDEANVFVSKLVLNSQGFVMDDDFDNGEKEVMEKIVQRIFSMEAKEKLEVDGITLDKDFTLSGINYFDVNKCYVTTVKSLYVKDCMINYNLLEKKDLDVARVEFEESHKFFSEGFVSSMALIVMGVAVIVFAGFVIYRFMFS